MCARNLVSVIVPIYKVEPFIHKCVDSIVSQTYRNLDIILVDDGSPDNCGIIADQYANSDSRITVIHKENGGLSDARNAGLKIAKGDFIVFVDSDDYINENYVDKMLSLCIENAADIAVCSHSFYDEIGNLWGNEVGKKKIQILDGVEASKIILYQKGYDVSAWGKIYKKSVFANLFFPKGLNFEDIPTTYQAFMKSNKVIFTNEKFYYYQIRANSIETEKFNYKKLDGIKTGEILINEVEKKYPQILSAARSRYFAINMHILAQIDSNIPEKEQIQNNIKKVQKYLLFDPNASIRVRIASLLTILSFKLTLKLLNGMKR